MSFLKLQWIATQSFPLWLWDQGVFVRQDCLEERTDRMNIVNIISPGQSNNYSHISICEAEYFSSSEILTLHLTLTIAITIPYPILEVS